MNLIPKTKLFKTINYMLGVWYWYGIGLVTGSFFYFKNLIFKIGVTGEEHDALEFLLEKLVYDLAIWFHFKYVCLNN